MAYYVFYRVGPSHWQDSLQTFEDGNDAIADAETYDFSRVTDERGQVVFICGKKEQAGFTRPFFIRPERGARRRFHPRSY